MRFAILIAAFGIMTGVPALVPVLTPAAHAQATDDVALPALSPQLQQQLNLALLGTPAQVKAKMAALIASNREFAIAIAANGAARNQALAADFAGEAAKVVPAAELGALYQAVGRAAPSEASNIATTIRASSPPGTDLANLEAAVVQPLNTAQTTQTNQTITQRQGPPPPQEPIVPIVPEPNPAQSGSPT